MRSATILPYIKNGPPADIRELARAHRGVERRRAGGALLLIAPTLVLLAASFLIPILMMLSRGVSEREVPAAWPRTTEALRAWDGEGLPSSQAFEALAEEIPASREAGTLSAAANRLNYDVAGYRSLVTNTARALPLPAGEPARQGLVRLDARWGEPETWATLKAAAGPLTGFYLLAAVDRRPGAEGIERVPAERAVFVGVFARTFEISAAVTLLCLLLGYPLAYLLASAQPRTANWLMILVLLPFWTSVLVRSTAWAVLLQTNGVINESLQWLNLISEPLRLIYNRTGVLVAMTHVLLPFLVLPLYGVMRGVPADLTRAALSLGATPLQAFARIYLPQTLPGVSAGALLVFVLALGYYVTPALVGGAGDQMISAFIAFYTNQSLNWGMAAALSIVLLAATLALMALYARLSGVRELTGR
ncbi:MAG: ABC transporter permease [Caulobacteraceae bacterium]|nr:ABC transporter permease [Caulobacteraceae bacterium]